MSTMSTAEMRAVEMGVTLEKSANATENSIVAALAWPNALISLLGDNKRKRRRHWYEDTSIIMTIGDD